MEGRCLFDHPLFVCHDLNKGTALLNDKHLLSRGHVYQEMTFPAAHFDVKQVTNHRKTLMRK